MEKQRGTTMFELVTVLAVVAVLAAVGVPGAAKAHAAVSGAQASRRLALVLRAAQARAQCNGDRVRVEVGAGGDYLATGVSGGTVAEGSLGARISSTYPGGVLEFTARGWAGLPGALSPRAGHFSVEGTAHSVVVQLSGCVRCS